MYLFMQITFMYKTICPLHPLAQKLALMRYVDLHLNFNAHSFQKQFLAQDFESLLPSFELQLSS